MTLLLKKEHKNTQGGNALGAESIFLLDETAGRCGLCFRAFKTLTQTTAPA